MSRRGRFRLSVALLLGPPLLVACDMLITDPAPSTPAIAIAFQLEETPLGGTATAFARVRQIGLHFVRPDSSFRDTLVNVFPSGGVIRAGIALPAPDRVEALGILAQLGYPGGVLFRGAGLAHVEPGVPTKVDMTLVPIPAAIVADRDQVTLVGPGATDRLEAAVLFASGDTIGALSGVWSSEDPSIAAIGPGGIVLAQRIGQTRFEVRLDTLTDTVRVDVVAPLPTGSLVRWINAAGGSWSVGANWSGGLLPVAGDSVEIALAGAFTVDLDVPAPVLSHLLLGGSGGTQTLSAVGRVLTIADRLEIGVGGTLLAPECSTLPAATSWSTSAADCSPPPERSPQVAPSRSRAGPSTSRAAPSRWASLVCWAP